MTRTVLVRRINREQRRECPQVGVYTGERVELLAQLCYPLSPAALPQ